MITEKNAALFWYLADAPPSSNLVDLPSTDLHPHARSPIGRWLCAALAVASWSAVAESAETYRFKLTYGGGAVCNAYLDRLVRTKFRSPPICRNDELASSKAIESLPTVAVPPIEVGRLAPQVGEVLFAVKTPRTSGTQAHSEVSDASYEAHPAALDQSRAILSGQPLKYYARFFPPADVDNDGTGDEVVIWRNSSSPCGDAYPHADDEVMITPIYLLILDARRNIDGTRTRRLLSDEMQVAALRAHDLRVPDAARVAQSPGRKLFGRSYGIFKFEGLYYSDVYYSLPIAGPQREPNTSRIGIFLNRNKTTSLACEIEETDVRSR
jgi:hypothetical protein